MKIVDNAINNNKNDITNEENKNINPGMINNSTTVNINISGIGNLSILEQEEVN